MSSWQVSEPFGSLSLHWRLPHNIRFPGEVGHVGNHQEKLGLPHAGESAPLIDVLHRLLWMVEHQPAMIPAYLDKARPDVERLRIVAQTLAGQTLAGNGNGGGKSLVAARGAEAAALRKLTTNWRTLIEVHRGPMM